MQTYLKYRPAWSQLLIFLGLAFAIFFTLSIVGMFFLSYLTGIGLDELKDVDKWDFSNPKLLYYIRGMLVIQFLGLFVIPSLLFSYFSDPRPARYLGLRQPWSARYWVMGIAVMLIAIPFVEYIGLLNQKINFGTEASKWMRGLEEDAAKQILFMMKKHTVSELLLNLLFIALFAGIGEEFLFRGVIQRLLIRAFKNPWMGIVVTAAIFSAIHFQFLGFLPRFGLGILLGAIYWYSGSLWPAVIAHFIYDGFIIVLAYLNPQMLDRPDQPMVPVGSPLIWAIVSLALTILLVLKMKKDSRTSYEEIYGEELAHPHNYRSNGI